jgi:hypothetical protein
MKGTQTMTSYAALLLTTLTAYGATEALLMLAGRSRLGRAGVVALATLTGFILPWAIVGGLAVLVTCDRDA